MFEVLLTSPRGAVIGAIRKAQVTIGRSGSRPGGGCPQNRGRHSQHTPVLGGQEILSDRYPQHGSIHLEKLPLHTQSLIWTQGAGVSGPFPGDTTGSKVRVISSSPQVVGVRWDSDGPGEFGLKKSASIRQVRPSSVFHNGTDVVFTVSPLGRSWAGPGPSLHHLGVSSPSVSWHRADAGGGGHVVFAQGQEG